MKKLNPEAKLRYKFIVAGVLAMLVFASIQILLKKSAIIHIPIVTIVFLSWYIPGLILITHAYRQGKKDALEK